MASQRTSERRIRLDFPETRGWTTAGQYNANSFANHFNYNLAYVQFFVDPVSLLVFLCRVDVYREGLRECVEFPTCFVGNVFAPPPENKPISS
ncbi:hypothetical protein F2P81_002259 [Scophthalmus maximus]|uniref:Uncharacterized protein n=1 Tax=Scophthalmus maximus TaxID=52904 RepID=A0A6A4TQ79_SCOMX|nr:hypothetical protein F2P81_002259 [Scophthalmus maximus]